MFRGKQRIFAAERINDTRSVREDASFRRRIYAGNTRQETGNERGSVEICITKRGRFGIPMS